MVGARVVFVALLLTSLTVACDFDRCAWQQDSYSGHGLLPGADGVTAEQILAEAEISLVQQRTWIPKPSEYESDAGTVPPLPYEGTTQLEVKVRRLSNELVDVYVHDWFTCAPSGNAEAPVRIVIRTSDGVLNEDVRGTVFERDGHSYVSATIAKPKGHIGKHFATLDDDPVTTPVLNVLITPQLGVNVQFELERRDQHRWLRSSYVTLL